MKREIIEVDGVKYQVVKCPKCGAELRFKLHKESRRVHCACAKCGAMMEVLVEHE